MTREFTEADDALLEELGVEVKAKPATSRTPQEERVIAGFEDIQRFVAEHGHTPQQGEDRDIFERLYAVRLNRIQEQADYRALVEPIDYQGLLAKQLHQAEVSAEELDDDALLEMLGINTETQSITQLKHVRSSAEKQVAEEIAHRDQCKDFHLFKPHFAQLQKELDVGLQGVQPFEGHTTINVGDFFIVGGQKAYVAKKGRRQLTKDGKKDARLQVIFDNGTESKMLMRSLQRALYKDDAGRRIVKSSGGPLFANYIAEGDEATGTIYILRSHSKLPSVTQHRDLVHKIGVTTDKVEHRIANARLEPTFLMADVEIISTYQLYNVNNKKLEKIIHRVFESAQLTIEVKDRFGSTVVPHEWFLVPLHIIDQAITKIKDGTIVNYIYDHEEVCLRRVT